VNITRRRFFGLALAATAAATMLGDIAGAPAARAFGPSLLQAGTAAPSAVPQQYGCLYPKTTECTNGTLLATFEQPAVLPVFPIYSSTNNGQTWTQISEVADTVNGWGNRCCAFLYTLPEALGDLPAGISAPLDDDATYLELYASTNNGSSWSFVSTIAEGGSYSTTAIWEPNLLLADGTLICYYSDSRDSAHSQKLSLQYSTNATTWSTQQNVVALSPEDLRPGMPVVSKLADGNYFLSYEVVNEASDTPTYFQISADPLSWDTSSIGTLIGSGGSPYNTVLPDGTLLYNDYSSGNVSINTDNGAGDWTSVITPIEAGYSRTLQYISGTGRVLIMACGGFWEGVVNSIYYADQDFGQSAGAYYQLVNRNSGMVLGVSGGSLANGAQLVVGGRGGGRGDNTGTEDQAWHVTTTDGVTKFGNRSSGQVIGIWQAGTADGDDAVQWLDTGSADQQWTLVADGDYYKIKNVNSGLLLSVLGAATTEGADIVQWADAGSLDQQWSLVELT